jgi:hypothetical protein
MSFKTCVDPLAFLSMAKLSFAVTGTPMGVPNLSPPNVVGAQLRQKNNF